MDDGSNDGAARWLIGGGVGLVMFGLLTGLVSGSLANPRMGLAAHVEALMNGIPLIALGAAWRHVRLVGWPIKAARGFDRASRCKGELTHSRSRR